MEMFGLIMLHLVVIGLLGVAVINTHEKKIQKVFLFLFILFFPETGYIMVKRNHIKTKVLKSVAIIFIVSLALGCGNKVPDELFFVHGEILDIKRDDESQYHLLVKLQNGSVQSFADLRCDIQMGNFSPCVEVPYVRYQFNGERRVLPAWKTNSTEFSNEKVYVCLPEGYEIQLFND